MAGFDVTTEEQLVRSPWPSAGENQ